MKILYLYPYYGELGWELWNWKTHCAYIAKNKGPFDHVFAVIREGREGIYPFVTEFDTFSDYGDCSEGNAFVLTRPDAYDHYKDHCKRCDKSVKKLEKSGHKVVIVRLPKSYYRYHRFKERHRLFEQLRPDAAVVERWSKVVNTDSVLFHLRHISRSPSKNTPEKFYKAAEKWARKNGRQFVTVGKTFGLTPKFEIKGVNLLNQTNLADLTAILSVGGMVVGSSSGPMHMAAATKTPHVVWGGGRGEVRARYKKNWNKLKTPVEFLTLGFTVDRDKMLKAMTKIASLPESDSDNRRMRRK